MKLDNRFIIIIKLLLESKDYIPSRILASKMNLSIKTISRIIKQYDENDLKLYGFSINSKPQYGYNLNVFNDKEFAKFQELYLTNIPMIINQYKYEKHIEIISYMIEHDHENIKIPKLAEDLFISESSFANYRKKINDLLVEFNMNILYRQDKGVYINGTESQKRSFLSSIVMAENLQTSEIKDNENANITSLLIETANKFNLSFTSFGLDDLVRHLFIFVKRNQLAKNVTFSSYELEEIQSAPEYIIAESIYDQLKIIYNLDDNPHEIAYLTIHLLGKRTTSFSKMDNIEKYKINDLIKEIFIEIKEIIGVDLSINNEIMNFLILHFEPMLTRLKYGLNSENPLLEEIKTQHSRAFEMGLIAKKVIFEKLAYSLNDSEVSYLSIYFSLALEQNIYKIQSHNILIVCGLGVWSSRILTYKIKEKYPQFVNIIDASPYHLLKTVDLSIYNLIISTVLQPIATSLPIIYITNALQDNWDYKLKSYFTNNAFSFIIEEYLKSELLNYEDTFATKEDAITYIIDLIKEHYEIPELLLTKTLEREKLSSTDYGNSCAIPHPLEMCTNETIFAVLVLKRAMIWGSSNVRFIFFLSPSKTYKHDLQYFIELLTKFITDTQRFSEFASNPTFDNLKKGLISIEQK
ncbi:BglG family transcription antiterminator [Lacrimispora sp.]|uniref:BglG family transcription antiterminator n=1 Tax=Lacrimispora sp. TaxID=2719234 RepID=UPI0028973895|nr:PRD domain-containing protein [Lacrimispora sp.]